MKSTLFMLLDQFCRHKTSNNPMAQKNWTKPNTKIIRITEGHDSPAMVVRLHDTIIVTCHGDGRIRLQAGGHYTSTTKARINEFLDLAQTGWKVVQVKGAWSLVNGEVEADFEDGITIEPLIQDEDNPFANYGLSVCQNCEQTITLMKNHGGMKSDIWITSGNAHKNVCKKVEPYQQTPDGSRWHIPRRGTVMVCLHCDQPIVLGPWGDNYNAWYSVENTDTHCDKAPLSNIPTPDEWVKDQWHVPSPKSPLLPKGTCVHCGTQVSQHIPLNFHGWEQDNAGNWLHPEYGPLWEDKHGETGCVKSPGKDKINGQQEPHQNWKPKLHDVVEGVLPKQKESLPLEATETSPVIAREVLADAIQALMKDGMVTDGAWNTYAMAKHVDKLKQGLDPHPTFDWFHWYIDKGISKQLLLDAKLKAWAKYA